MAENSELGAALNEVQAQAGHAQGSTTLRYAQATNAEQRRVTAHLRYGATKIK